MGAEIEIPDEAQIRAERAVAPYALSGPDTVTAVEVALEAAAPLIVAAALDQAAAWITPVPDPEADDEQVAYQNGKADAAETLSRRASELRGEAQS